MKKAGGCAPVFLFFLQFYTYAKKRQTMLRLPFKFLSAFSEKQKKTF